MAKETSKGDAPITIKKYANRRLYNTAKSSYVTLDHLAQMVRDGQDFVVFDAKSGDDITRSVLTQIIFEEEAKGQNMLPISFLRQLIRLYGDTIQGFVPGYLEASMETFTRNQDGLREQVKSAMGANPALANFEAMARTNMEFFDNAMRMFTPFGAVKPGGDDRQTAPGDKAAAAPKPQDPPAAAAAQTEPEIKALKDQLAEMQSQLNQLAKGR